MHATSEKLSKNSEMVILAAQMQKSAGRLIRLTDHGVEPVVKSESWLLLKKAFSFWFRTKLGHTKRG
jgi:hypothetical protein